MDKINEPIDAALRAYGDRLAAQEGLPEKLTLYLNPREEKTKMMAGRNLIAETQTIMEGPLPFPPRGPIKLSPQLETILEVSSQKQKEQSESPEPADNTTYLSRQITIPEEIPEADEHQALSLWREVRRQVEEERSGKGTPPFPFVEDNHPLEDRWAADSINRRTATRSMYREDLGRREEGKDKLEKAIAHQALSSLVTCTLPLKDLIRLRPGVMKRMAQELLMSDKEIPKLLSQPNEAEEPTREPEAEKVSVYRVSKRLGPSEGNTTLPVEHGSIISIAILDSGAGISVATKSI